MLKTSTQPNPGDEQLALWLNQRVRRKSAKFPGHSIYFESFPPRTITVPPGYATDYLGNRWPTRFGLAESPGTYETAIPEVNEEYFEIVDILEAVLDADTSFTFHEWGSGFARWSSFAVAAARHRGIDKIRCACVEAEPKHLAYSIETLQSLGLTSRDSVFFPFALAGSDGTDLFVVGRKEDAHNSDPWFGQALNDMNEYEPTGTNYMGQPLLENPNGFQAITVSVKTPSVVLADFDFIDIVDMDIQGAEADAVEQSIDQLNAKVRRLHIGTHSSDAEDRLRRCLSSHRWILLRDLPHQSRSSTEFGSVDCVDGVQSWFNPRFPPQAWMEAKA